MRLLVAALVVGCSSSHSPEWKDDDFVYPFALETDDTRSDPTAIKYEYRLDGDCVGKGAAGEPFTPHKDRSGSARPVRFVTTYPGDTQPVRKSTAVWLAPKPDIAVGVIVGDEHRGCMRARLDRTYTTVLSP